MPYCILDDISEQIPEEELISLTDDANVGVIDTSITDRAVADADAEIDGYCGRQYSVPLDPVPGIIRKFSVDICIYNLFSRRQGAPEDRRTRYKDAIKFLENVAKGIVTLGVDDPDSTPSDTHAPQISSSERIFSRSKLKGY